MSELKDRSPLLRRGAHALVIIALMGGAAAGAQSSSPPADAAKTTAPGNAQLEPPDGKWLVDEEGREYFPYEYSTRYPFLWLDEEHKKVRLGVGLVMDVLSADDQKIVVKVYRPVAFESPAPRPSVAPAQIAEAFANDTPTADRLTFASFGEGLPNAGQWRNGLLVADMNRDGQPDIVHGPPRKAGSKPAIFLGDGAGHFRVWKEAKYPDIALDYGDIAVADLNRDRKPDLVVASHLLGVTAMIGDGKGRFTSWSEGMQWKTAGAPGPTFSSRAVVTGDWNRDGRPDVVAVGDGPQFLMGRSADPQGAGSRGAVVYLNGGKGKWTEIRGPQVDDYGDSVAVGDFNADRKLDLAMSTHVWGSQRLVDLQQADGTFVPQEFPQRPDSSIRAVYARDLDGDRRDDLVVGYTSKQFGTWHGGIDIYYSRRDGFQRRALASWEGQTRVHSLAGGDVDGDGKLDLAASRSDGKIELFLGDGKGWFVSETGDDLQAEKTGCAAFRVALANLDHQRGDEVIANFAGEEPARIGIPEVDDPRMAEACTTGGAIRAWKARPQAPAPR